MRIIIVCGNDDCRQEYKVETTDRFWECPYCGRKRESDHYPFLTAKFMQARIDGDMADWETIHNEALEKADIKVQENDRTIGRLEHDAGVAVEDGGQSSEHKAGLKRLIKDDEAAEADGWRKRAEAVMKTARAIIIAQEDRIKALEQELEKKKKQKAPAEKDKPVKAGKGKAKGPVRKSRKELEEEDLIDK